MRILVTGSTDGIGLETARQLAAMGHEVIVHGRRPSRIESAVREIGRLGPTPEALRADFASLEEVDAMAGVLREDGRPLDVLVNNAGVYLTTRTETVDGFESTFAINHLAPFLLTLRLLSLIPRGGRIVNVASVAHHRGTIALDDLNARRRFDAYGAYAQSKLANVLFTVELARRLEGRGIAVNALHPGVVSTKLLKAGFDIEGPDSLGEGAATSVFLATSPEVEGISGRYFRDRAEDEMAPSGRDPSLARALYEASLRMTGQV